MSLSHQLLWRKVPLGILEVPCSRSFLPRREQQEAGMEGKEQCGCGRTRKVVVNPSQNPCLDTAQGCRAMGGAEELKEELLSQVPLPNVCIWLLAER